MKRLAIHLSLLVGLSSLVLGGKAMLEKTFALPDGDVHFTYERLEPPVIVNLKTQADAGSPLEASLKFYKDLAAGNIDAASRLSTNPKKSLEMWTAYKARLGDADFQKMTDEYFSEGRQVTHVLYLGKGRALLIKDPTDGDLGVQFFVCNTGLCLMADPEDLKELDQLGQIFSAIKQNKLKL